MNRVGIPPPVAKSMEVWEAAAALGVGASDDEPAVPGSGVPRSDIDLIKQRMAHAEGKGPAPQPFATNPDEAAAMMNALSLPMKG